MELKEKPCRNVASSIRRLRWSSNHIISAMAAGMNDWEQRFVSRCGCDDGGEDVPEHGCVRTSVVIDILFLNFQ